MILDKIVERTKERVSKLKSLRPLNEVQAQALSINRDNDFAFERSLRARKFAFICEVKKASPSKGIIAEHFPYKSIAQEYQKAGAAAISVLTEPDFFLGSDNYLSEIKQVVDIPLLRKDFTIDEYQIYEAKCIGADAILLICALLPTKTLARYIQIADSLGLSALVEAHDEQEVHSALAAGARIIGVNNRNLKDFSVNMDNSINLRKLVPQDIIFVAESGINNYEDIKLLKASNITAALIGETLMRSTDKAASLAALSGHSNTVKLKICGMTRPEDILSVNEYRPDYIGFVFAPSHRQVTLLQALTLKNMLAKDILAVGVFVNAKPQEIATICQTGAIDIVQLHGEESEDYIHNIKQLTKKPIIKAIRVKTAADIAAGQASCADYLLLDTYSPSAYGGSGECFDWSVIGKLTKPYFLAGGINIKNAATAIMDTEAFALDASSALETNKLKDNSKIRELCELLQSINSSANNKRG